MLLTLCLLLSPFLFGGALGGLPTVRVLGANPVELVVGHRYHDAGATCTDGPRDLTRNLEAIATVLPFKVGVYHVHYFCRNAHGEQATAQRTVQVIPAHPSTARSRRYAYSRAALLKAISGSHTWSARARAKSGSVHPDAEQAHWAQQARSAPLTAMLVLCRVPASAVEAAGSPTRRSIGVAVARALGGWFKHISAATVVLGARWNLDEGGGSAAGGGALTRAVHDAGLRACSSDGAWAREHPTSVVWVQLEHGLDGKGQSIAPRLRSTAFGEALARAFSASSDPVLRRAGKVLPGAPRAAGVVAAIRHSAVAHEDVNNTAAAPQPVRRGAIPSGVVLPPMSAPHTQVGTRTQATPLHALSSSGTTSTAAPQEIARLGMERLAMGSVILGALVIGYAWRRVKTSVHEKIVEEKIETETRSSAHTAAATALEESHALLA